MGVRERAASGYPAEDAVEDTVGGGGDSQDQRHGILVVLIIQLCLHEQ
jgi:hypothetical protein